jgi:hypothetical protein
MVKGGLAGQEEDFQRSRPLTGGLLWVSEHVPDSVPLRLAEAAGVLFAGQ